MTEPAPMRPPPDTGWLVMESRRPRRARPGWLPVLVLGLVLGLVLALLGWQQATRRADAVTAERDALGAAVERACSAYAPLDLVALVEACRSVGYQQTYEGAGAGPFPYTGRRVMPEDLDR